MKTVDQVSRGVASFFDEEVRPSLSGGKGILYGVVVGRMAANLPQIINQYAAILAPLGIIKEEGIDVEGLASDLRQQIQKAGGTLSVPVMGDTFKFNVGDVDNLIRHIERA